MSVAFFRDFNTYELGRTGDATTRAIQAEWGVCMHEEAAHGIVADFDHFIMALGANTG